MKIHLTSAHCSFSRLLWSVYWFIQISKSPAVYDTQGSRQVTTSKIMFLGALHLMQVSLTQVIFRQRWVFPVCFPLSKYNKILIYNWVNSVFYVCLRGGMTSQIISRQCYKIRYCRMSNFVFKRKRQPKEIQTCAHLVCQERSPLQSILTRQAREQLPWYTILCP